jgi:hypothetical protein
LAWYFVQSSTRREGLAWLDLVVDVPEAEDLRPELLAIAGRIANDLARPDAEALLRRSIECSAETGRPEVPVALTTLSVTLMQQNRTEESHRFAEHAVEVARVHGRTYDVIDALNTFSMVCNFTGQEERARHLALESVDLAEALGNAYQLGFSRVTAGIAHCRSDPRRGIEFLETSMVYQRWDANRAGICRLFQGIAHLHLGELRQAASDLGESLVQFHVDPNEYYLRMVTLVTTGLLVEVRALAAAGRLLSALDHLRGATRFVGTPYQLEAYQRMRARLEGTADPATLAAAWAEGQSMTLDDTVALAREELAKLIEQEDETDEPG